MRPPDLLTIVVAFVSGLCPVSVVQADESAKLEQRLAKDQAQDVRLEAIEAATHLPREAAIAAIPHLAEFIGDEDEDVRIGALNAIAHIALEEKLPCPEVIVETLFHKEPTTRDLAAVYINALPPIPEKFTPRLLDALVSDDSNVRASVSYPLATYGLNDKRTVPALRKATEDKVLKVRSNAFTALFKATHDYDAVVPFWLEQADGQYDFPAPDKDGREPMIWAKGEAKFHAKVAASAIRRLGREEPERIGQFLVGCLSDNAPRLRRSAASALGMLASDNPKSREALNKLKARDAVVKLKEDGDESVRDAAKIALRGFTRNVIYSTVPRDSGWISLIGP